MAYFLGIEAGTTKIKAALADDEQGFLASASADCAVPCDRDGRAEIAMEKYWRACRECLAAVARKSRKDLKNVAALSIASQGVTFVPVDRRGRPLRKGIVLYDHRAQHEASDLIDRFGEESLYQITGQPKISAMYEGAKLLWLRRHERRRFQNIHKILLVHDYLVYKLTGTFAAAASLLSSSLLFNVKKAKWWNGMLKYLGLSPDQLPEIYEHGQPVESVSRKASRETGLSTKTLVVAGALDQICGMTGMGNIAPGLISESTGTVLAVHTLSDAFFPQMDCGILNFCHLQGGRYALIGVCPTACSALDWLMKNLVGHGQATAARTQGDVEDLLFRKAENVPAGADGLLMLPHLAGRGSPRPNPQASGVFYGFRLHHRREHFVRALMEAIAYALRDNIELFRRQGLTIQEVRSFGGGARSRLWNQMKADITGLPVVTSRCPEPGCLGAAILAGIGAGVFQNLEAGCRRFVALRPAQDPRQTAREKYERFFREYRELEARMP
jgi:xylulokinase